MNDFKNVFRFEGYWLRVWKIFFDEGLQEYLPMRKISTKDLRNNWRSENVLQSWPSPWLPYIVDNIFTRIEKKRDSFLIVNKTL